MAFIPSSATTLVFSKHTNTDRLSFASHSCRRTSFIQAPPPLIRQLSWNHFLSSTPRPPLVIPSPSPFTITASAVPQVLISGAPASGKGTQCEFIVQKYGLVHISTGDMLRAAVKTATPLGVEAKSYMDAGQLVPDDLVISMLKQRITMDDCRAKGWLLDGFPRTVVQAKALDEAGILPSAVFLLQVADDVLIERVIGRRSDPVTGKIYHIKFGPATDPDVKSRLVQRSDDTEEKARVRLEAYYKHSRAIQDHYGPILNTVDGNRPKGDVFTDLSNAIDASLGSESDQDHDGHDGHESSGNSMALEELETSASTTIESVKSIPVAEFVRRAEEAYERGVLQEEDVNWSGQAGVDRPNSGGTSSYADLSRRPDLLLGDIFALLSFAYIGRASHGDKSFDIDVIKTAAPFIAAWILASPLLGAYTRTATTNVPTALKFFSRSWAIAVPMGIGLRGVLTDHVPPAVFAVISLVSTFIIMGSWRVVYVKIRGEETDAARRGGIIDGFKMVTTLLRRW